MRAVTLAPGKAGSQRLDEVPEPPEKPGSILVRALAVGVCGTDRELVDGLYGEAAPGRERLVLGHKSLGRVISAPPDSDFAIGDMVVGMVARPDPVPCVNCAVGEWDMCRNGLYTERGIKQADGFCAERWRSDPGFAIKVTPVLGLAAVLLEPASVLAKAWEHIERIGRRARWAPERVVITGAGPVGLMAALMGVQRGLEVHVMDRNESGPKPALVRELGASYDVAKLNQSMVLENRVVFGTVNANLRHYLAAADALSHASRAWLDKLITRRVGLKNWHEAYEKRLGDVKTVLLFED